MQVTLSQTSLWGPALTASGEQLILGWTGSGNNELNLSSSSDGGQSWGIQTTINETSAAAPALALFGNALYIAWAGTDSNSSLHVMQTSDLKSFPVQMTFAESVHSTSGPALAVFKNVLYIAWTGSDRNLNVAQIVNNSLANKVTLATDTDANGQTHASPALAADDDYLYIAWTAIDYSDSGEGNPLVFLPTVILADSTASAPNMYLMRSSDGSNFSGLVNTHETSSGTNGPALTVNGGNLVLGWTGSGDNGYLSTMYSTDKGQSFTGKVIDKSNTSDNAPALSGGMIAWTGTDDRLNLKQGV